VYLKAAASALALAAGLLYLPAPAAACSCFGGEDVLPGRWAIDVPRDVQVVAVAPPRGLVFHPPTIELRVAGEAQVVVSSVETRSRADRSSYLLVLRPDEPLQPNTTYEVQVNSGSPSSFTTGEGFAGSTSGPSFSGLEHLAAEAMEFPGSSSEDCILRRDGSFHRLRIEHAGAGPDVAYLLLELERPDEPDWSDFVPLMSAYQLEASSIESTLCGARPPALEVGASYCARLVAYDVAGNRTSGEPTLCAQVEQCRTEHDDRGWPADPCTPAGGCGCGAGGDRGGGLAILLLAALILRGRNRSRTGAAYRSRPDQARGAG
jgi:hypothetical protein